MRTCRSKPARPTYKKTPPRTNHRTPERTGTSMQDPQSRRFKKDTHGTQGRKHRRGKHTRNTDTGHPQFTKARTPQNQTTRHPQNRGQEPNPPLSNNAARTTRKPTERRTTPGPRRNLYDTTPPPMLPPPHGACAFGLQGLTNFSAPLLRDAIPFRRRFRNE